MAAGNRKRHERLGEVAVLFVCVGIAVVTMWPISTGQTGRIHGVLYLAALLLGALGVLLMVLWGVLVGVNAWRTRGEKARRGFEVKCPERAKDQEGG